MTIRLQCRGCNDITEVEVSADSFDGFIERRLLAQQAFPHLSADVRELFLSGLCGPCYDHRFLPQTERELSS